MEEKLAELIRMVLAQESNTDSLEIGEAKRRVKVYFNAAEPAAAEIKIKNAIDLAKKGEVYNLSQGEKEMKE